LASAGDSALQTSKEQDKINYYLILLTNPSHSDRASDARNNPTNIQHDADEPSAVCF